MLKILRGYFKKGLLIVPPKLWGICFILIPLFVVLKISLSKTTAALPPYEAMFHFDESYMLNVRLYIKHYIDLLTNDFYLYVTLSSLKIAALSTFFSLILGYGVAYGISLLTPKKQWFFLILVMLPFFTSFLMRVYAWITMLSTHGVINSLLVGLHIIKEPLHILDSTLAVCIGTVYCYLPFMILPIYVALSNIDPSYIEAAQDLGAKPAHTFFKIILPLSLRGIVTGCTLVFIPVMGEFVIPELLGSSKVVTLGRAIFFEFSMNHDWPMTCAMAIVTIIMLVIPIMILQNERGRSAL